MYKKYITSSRRLAWLVRPGAEAPGRPTQSGPPGSHCQLPPCSILQCVQSKLHHFLDHKLNVFPRDPFLTYLALLFVVGKYVNSNKLFIMTRWNVLIEIKQYLVMIRFLCKNMINTKHQAAAGPGQARGRARVPGRRVRGPGLGPGRRRLVFCIYHIFAGFNLSGVVFLFFLSFFTKNM